ncbi:hypothetical protein, partial [Rhodanobacter sp. B04]|uniref:hypothetical protein n=1 Tax=Rhodanobacter sp. B04 TaxID=1945860 RepID=UPI001C2C6AE8
MGTRSERCVSSRGSFGDMCSKPSGAWPQPDLARRPQRKTSIVSDGGLGDKALGVAALAPAIRARDGHRFSNTAKTKACPGGKAFVDELRDRDLLLLASGRSAPVEPAKKKPPPF